MYHQANVFLGERLLSVLHITAEFLSNDGRNDYETMVLVGDGVLLVFLRQVRFIWANTLWISVC